MHINNKEGDIKSQVTGVLLGQGFFAACSCVIGAVGVVWGLTYKEICVIGYIYLEAGICLLSALWLTWNTIKAYGRNRLDNIVCSYL